MNLESLIIIDRAKEGLCFNLTDRVEFVCLSSGNAVSAEIRDYFIF